MFDAGIFGPVPFNNFNDNRLKKTQCLDNAVKTYETNMMKCIKPDSYKVFCALYRNNQWIHDSKRKRLKYMKWKKLLLEHCDNNPDKIQKELTAIIAKYCLNDRNNGIIESKTSKDTIGINDIIKNINVGPGVVIPIQPYRFNNNISNYHSKKTFQDRSTQTDLDQSPFVPDPPSSTSPPGPPGPKYSETESSGSLSKKLKRLKEEVLNEIRMLPTVQSQTITNQNNYYGPQNSRSNGDPTPPTPIPVPPTPAPAVREPYNPPRRTIFKRATGQPPTFRGFNDNQYTAFMEQQSYQMQQLQSEQNEFQRQQLRLQRDQFNLDRRQANGADGVNLQDSRFQIDLDSLSLAVDHHRLIRELTSSINNPANVILVNATELLERLPTESTFMTLRSLFTIFDRIRILTENQTDGYILSIQQPTHGTEEIQTDFTMFYENVILTLEAARDLSSNLESEQLPMGADYNLFRNIIDARIQTIQAVQGIFENVINTSNTILEDHLEVEDQLDVIRNVVENQHIVEHNDITTAFQNDMNEVAQNQYQLVERLTSNVNRWRIAVDQRQQVNTWQNLLDNDINSLRQLRIRASNLVNENNALQESTRTLLSILTNSRLISSVYDLLIQQRGVHVLRLLAEFRVLHPETVQYELDEFEQNMNVGQNTSNQQHVRFAESSTHTIEHLIDETQQQLDSNNEALTNTPLANRQSSHEHPQTLPTEQMTQLADQQQERQQPVPFTGIMRPIHTAIDDASNTPQHRHPQEDSVEESKNDEVVGEAVEYEFQFEEQMIVQSEIRETLQRILEREYQITNNDVSPVMDLFTRLFDSSKILARAFNLYSIGYYPVLMNNYIFLRQNVDRLLQSNLIPNANVQQLRQDLGTYIDAITNELRHIIERRPDSSSESDNRYYLDTISHIFEVSFTIWHRNQEATFVSPLFRAIFEDLRRNLRNVRLNLENYIATSLSTLGRYELIQFDIIPEEMGLLDDRIGHDLQQMN